MEYVKNEICFLGMYSALLNYYEIPITERELLIRCKKIAFQYHYVKENTSSDHCWQQSDYCYLIGTLDTLEGIDINTVRLTEKSFLHVEDQINYIFQVISKGNALLVYVDVFDLHYHPQYKKLHASTLVMICGVQGDDYLVYDGYVTTIPPTYFVGYVSKNTINKAIWKEKHINTGKYWGIIVVDKGTDIFQVDTCSKISENAQSMLMTQNAHCGVEGIRNLSFDIEQWGEQWDEEKISDNMRRIYHNITSRGGPAISRKVYRDFILYSSLFDEKAKQNICDLLILITKKWNAIAIKAFRCSINFNIDYIRMISLELRNVAEMETILWKKMYEDVNSSYMQIV